MSEKISVVIIEPGKSPRHVLISNTLENLQKTVGGYIETVTLASDLVIICDEEGRIKNKPYCCDICGISFVGTVIICGIEGEEFADLPVEYKYIKNP
ncbi:MAG: DUF3846 domain-containing protein [Ruminococcaceae bacterium]|nr:DUF3846 domain-containing protein [Oscillospiraceae bacterium]